MIRTGHARIALLQYADGEKRYIIAPEGVKVGEILRSGADAEIKTATRCRWRTFPAGTFVHNIEMRPGKGAQLARSAGMAVQLMAKEGKFAQFRLPSGEMRNVPCECMATIGMRRQFRPRKYQHRQSGPIAVAGHSSPIAWCCDESGRPPAWWRRRKISSGKSPSGFSVGMAYQGFENPVDQEAVQQVHRQTQEVTGEHESFAQKRSVRQCAAAGTSVRR